MKTPPVIYSILFAGLVPFISFSQSYLGVEGGLVKSWLKYSDGQDSESLNANNAYQFGSVFYHTKGKKVWKAGFYFNQKGDQNYKFNAFEVPVMIGFQPFKGRSGVAFFGGSYFSWWHRVLSGDGDNSFLDRNEGREVLEKSHPLNNKWDIGWKAGMETYMLVGEGAKLTLGLFASQGIKSHRSGHQSPGLQFRQVSLTLGYTRAF